MIRALAIAILFWAAALGVLYALLPDFKFTLMG